MPRFFIEPREVRAGESVTLTGEDAHHISYSLRARPGDRYSLCDTDGCEYNCIIHAIDAESVTFEVLEKAPAASEPSVCVTLYQALVKGDKFDSIVQKAVELGVNRIVPVLTERCVSRPDAGAFEKKRERWQKIARSAAMQCARAAIPEVGELVGFDECLADLCEADCGFVCYEAEPHIPMKRLFEEAAAKKTPSTYSFFVGPEGGIAPSEAEKATAADIPLASLGKRILRTETAPLCVIASIMFFSDNLN